VTLRRRWSSMVPSSHRDCKVNVGGWKIFARICRALAKISRGNSARVCGGNWDIHRGKENVPRPFTTTLIRLSRVRIVEIGFCRSTWRSRGRRLAKGVGRWVLPYLHVSKYGLVPSYVVCEFNSLVRLFASRLLRDNKWSSACSSKLHLTRISHDPSRKSSSVLYIYRVVCRRHKWIASCEREKGTELEAQNYRNRRGS